MSYPDNMYTNAAKVAFQKYTYTYFLCVTLLDLNTSLVELKIDFP